MSSSADSAEEKVRGALSASVALLTAEVEGFNVAPSILLEGSDPELVARCLSVILANVFQVTLPDHGRQILIRIGRVAVQPDSDGQAGR